MFHRFVLALVVILKICELAQYNWQWRFFTGYYRKSAFLFILVLEGQVYYGEPTEMRSLPVSDLQGNRYDCYIRLQRSASFSYVLMLHCSKNLFVSFQGHARRYIYGPDHEILVLIALPPPPPPQRDIDEGSGQTLWSSSWYFCINRICEQRMLRWTCTFAQCHNSLCCSHWKKKRDVDEGSGPTLSLLWGWFCCCWFNFWYSSHWIVGAPCLVLA